MKTPPSIDKKFLLEPDLKVDPHGRYLIGKNPLEIGGEVFEQAGISPISPLRAIRKKCIDCSVGQFGEVRKCVHIDCPLWPLRLGKSPFLQRRERDA